MKEVKMLPCPVAPADVVVFNLQPEAEPRLRPEGGVVTLPMRSDDSEYAIEFEEWVFDSAD